MAVKVSQTDISTLAGKSAVFVRGFGEYLQERHRKGHRNAKLRVAQEAGATHVARKGDKISVPYISQLSSRIEKQGIYEKTRSGKSYIISWTDESIALLLELLDSAYGTEEAVREITVEDMKDRSRVINHLDEFGGLIITHDNPVPKAAYKLLWDRFNKGELVMGFFEPDTDQGVLEDFEALDQ